MTTRKKCLFFCEGPTPTEDEQTQIDMLAVRYNVGVRNNNRDSRYGTHLEQADALAGSIPENYLTGEGETVDTEAYPDGDVTPDADVLAPEGVLMVPASIGGVTANGGTVQLNAVIAQVDEESGDTTVALKNTGTGVSWTSGTPSKATVANGLVTGANGGTGAVNITWKWIYRAADAEAEPPVVEESIERVVVVTLV